MLNVCTEMKGEDLRHVIFCSLLNNLLECIHVSIVTCWLDSNVICNTHSAAILVGDVELITEIRKQQPTFALIHSTILYVR